VVGILVVGSSEVGLQVCENGVGIDVVGILVGAREVGSQVDEYKVGLPVVGRCVVGALVHVGGGVVCW